MTLFTLMYMHIVILCLSSYGVAYSPILYFHKRNGRNLTAPDDIDYFNGLCDDFRICLRNNQKQFAALTIGHLKENQFKPQKPTSLNKCIDMIEHTEMTNNYAVALPTNKRKVHSERTLLNAFENMSAWSNGPDVVDVYLFSYWSPCGKCARDIVNTSKDLNNLKLHLSWQSFFESPKTGLTFFGSLEILFELGPNKLKVYWKNDKKKCGDFERISYQYLFYQCLVNKVKNSNTTTEDLAKLVNKLTYTCNDRMDTYTGGDECIDTFINNTTLIDHGNKQIFRDCKPTNGIRPLLGPPLKPNDPIYGSQSLDDLRGNYTFGFDNKD